MKQIVIVVLSLFSYACIGQTIQMIKDGGVYKVPCTVNGLSLSFIIDTGASNVTISLTEAVFMLKNGYLKESDIQGAEKYQIASGEIAEGTKIVFKSIKIGGLTITDVEATVLHNINSPLLFGLSALERFGKIEIDYQSRTINIKTSDIQNNEYSEQILKTNFGYGESRTKSVVIGNQTWIDKNLNIEHFANGDSIAQFVTKEEWVRAYKLKIPGWCYYENDNNGGAQGKLYNWYAVVDSRGLCPNGWHVPTDEEWTSLSSSIGNDSGMLLKSTESWKENSGTDFYKYSALANGSRNKFGEFNLKGQFGYWWSSTESTDELAYSRSIFYENNELYRKTHSKGSGFSVRCLKN